MLTFEQSLAALRECSNMLLIHITFRYLFIHQNPSSQHIFSIYSLAAVFFWYIKRMSVSPKTSLTTMWHEGMKKCDPQERKEKKRVSEKIFSLHLLYCVVNKDVYLHIQFYVLHHILCNFIDGREWKKWNELNVPWYNIERTQ